MPSTDYEKILGHGPMLVYQYRKGARGRPHVLSTKIWRRSLSLSVPWLKFERCLQDLCLLLVIGQSPCDVRDRFSFISALFYRLWSELWYRIKRYTQMICPSSRCHIPRQSCKALHGSISCYETLHPDEVAQGGKRTAYHRCRPPLLGPANRWKGYMYPYHNTLFRVFI